MDPSITLSTPFLTSPREVRDIIYKHIVVADHAMNSVLKVHQDVTALFRLCRQVYEEATEIYYKENCLFIPETFLRFGKPLQSVPTAKLLCGLTASRLGMLRTLDVDMPVCKDTLPGFKRKIVAS